MIQFNLSRTLQSITAVILITVFLDLNRAQATEPTKAEPQGQTSSQGIEKPEEGAKRNALRKDNHEKPCRLVSCRKDVSPITGP